jgi:predicted PurR-regulated permease PerM
MLTFLMAPAVDALKRLRIPQALGSAIVIIALFTVISASFYIFYQPAADWIERAPQSLRKVEQKLRFIKRPVEKVSEATKSMEKITDVGPKSEGSTTVEVKKTRLLNTLFIEASGFIFGVATMLILLYFLLASGDLFLRKVINALTTLKDKKQAVEIARHLERDISTYLYTIVIINFCLGVLIGGAMYVLKMPNPFLWGVMAGLVNFIPYLGQAAGIIIIVIVASTTFDNTYQAIMPPLVYCVIIGLEGNIITPIILGRRLLLNPVMIFLALLLWGWIWGIPGALFAVPILVILKIICDNIESLGAIGEFLGK